MDSELFVLQFFADYDTHILVMILTILSGFLLKIANHWTVHVLNRNNESARIREELRSELNMCRDTLVRLNLDMDEWRQRYWEEVESHSETKSRMAILLTQDEPSDRDPPE